MILILTATILWTGPTFTILRLQSVSAPVFFDAPSPACSDRAEPRERPLHHRWRGHAFRSKQVRASISQKPQSGTSGYGEEIFLRERKIIEIGTNWIHDGTFEGWNYSFFFFFFKGLIGVLSGRSWTHRITAVKNGEQRTRQRRKLVSFVRKNWRMPIKRI